MQPDVFKVKSLPWLPFKMVLWPAASEQIVFHFQAPAGYASKPTLLENTHADIAALFNL